MLLCRRVSVIFLWLWFRWTRVLSWHLLNSLYLINTLNRNRRISPGCRIALSSICSITKLYVCLTISSLWKWLNKEQDSRSFLCERLITIGELSYHTIGLQWSSTFLTGFQYFCCLKEDTRDFTIYDYDYIWYKFGFQFSWIRKRKLNIPEAHLIEDIMALSIESRTNLNERNCLLHFILLIYLLCGSLVSL